MLPRFVTRVTRFVLCNSCFGQAYDSLLDGNCLYLSELCLGHISGYVWTSMIKILLFKMNIHKLYKLRFRVVPSTWALFETDLLSPLCLTVPFSGWLRPFKYSDIFNEHLLANSLAGSWRWKIFNSLLAAAAAALWAVVKYHLPQIQYTTHLLFTDMHNNHRSQSLQKHSTELEMYKLESMACFVVYNWKKGAIP